MASCRCGKHVTPLPSRVIPLGAPPTLCSSCKHAAFDTGGVFCKLFNESIWDERTAEECSEFQVPPRVTSVIGIKTAIDGECDRRLRFGVTIDYFGRPEHGDGITESLRLHLRNHFGDRVTVTRND